ncbi:MAG: TolC family protein [Bryobacter sp.]|nr:TolC family protein [Bryobacter sp.]
MRLALLLVPLALGAEVRTMTLRQVNQSPEVFFARYDEMKAQHALRQAQDPFYPKVIAGSGLAYTSGFPLSIEGSAPSIIRADAIQAIYNRPQRYRVAQQREYVRGAAIDSQARREEVVYRAATLFLDAGRAGRNARTAAEQIRSLEAALAVVRARVEEGREIPLEGRRAEVALQRARYRSQLLDAEQTAAEHQLAMVLGLESSVRVRPAEEDRIAAALPESEEAAVTTALESSTELRKLQSNLQAKALEIKANRAAKLPQIDLVAQYGLFGRYNNYEDYFRTFTRHNGQLGVSFQIPILAGTAAAAQADQAEAESARLRMEINNTRTRLGVEARRAWQEVATAQSGRELARADLDLARDEVAVLLARYEEGRVTLKQLEEARFLEQEKWIAFHNAGFVLERARLNVLRQSGNLLAALRP